MELSHDDIGDISLALRHRIVSVQEQLDGRDLDSEDREEYTEELARLQALVKRVDAERPAAQRRFVEREG
jgi:hypothetical protein